jgi:hypothetical protein
MKMKSGIHEVKRVTYALFYESNGIVVVALFLGGVVSLEPSSVTHPAVVNQ